MDSVEYSNISRTSCRETEHVLWRCTAVKEIKHQWKLSRQWPTGLSLMGSTNYPKERHHTDTEYEVRASIYILNKPASRNDLHAMLGPFGYILRSPTPDPPGSQTRPGNVLEYGVCLGYTVYGVLYGVLYQTVSARCHTTGGDDPLMLLGVIMTPYEVCISTYFACGVRFIVYLRYALRAV